MEELITQLLSSVRGIWKYRLLAAGHVGRRQRPLDPGDHDGGRLPVDRAGVPASQMGQVVQVIESATTTQCAVKEALHRLGNCAHIKLICNKTRACPGVDYDGYHD